MIDFDEDGLPVQSQNGGRVNTKRTEDLEKALIDCLRIMMRWETVNRAEKDRVIRNVADLLTPEQRRKALPVQESA